MNTPTNYSNDPAIDLAAQLYLRCLRNGVLFSAADKREVRLVIGSEIINRIHAEVFGMVQSAQNATQDPKASLPLPSTDHTKA